MAGLTAEELIMSRLVALTDKFDTYVDTANERHAAMQGTHDKVDAIHLHVLDIKGYVKNLETLPSIAASLSLLTKIVGVLAVSSMLITAVYMIVETLGKNDVKAFSANTNGVSIERYEQRKGE